MKQIDTSRFADDATLRVIGVPVLLSRLRPDTLVAQRTASVGSTMTTRQEWAEFSGRVEATRRWSEDEARLLAVREHLRGTSGPQRSARGTHPRFPRRGG
ncbi:MAG: hypothetical protein R3E66_14820 [bacterium]